VRLSTQGLDSGTKSLVHSYAGCVLHNMEQDIRNVVQQVFEKEFPESWLRPRIDSAILSQNHGDQIRMWLADEEHTIRRHTVKQIDLQLLYRASSDGWDAEDFHLKCDEESTTITVIKCAGGYIFGGYSDVSWKPTEGQDEGHYRTSDHAFTFSLHSPNNVGPVKQGLGQKGSDRSLAIFCRTQQGPQFGENPAVSIATRAHIDKKSYAYSYMHTKQKNQGSTTFYQSVSSFLAAEVEVFRVVLSDGKLRVPLENFDSVFERVPNMCVHLLDLCTRSLYKDVFFFVKGVRGLFPGGKRRLAQKSVARDAMGRVIVEDGLARFEWMLEEKETPIQQSGDVQMIPPWPSSEAQEIMDNPPLLLADRFSGVIDNLVDDVRQRKLVADSLILHSVTRSIAAFSQEVACVEKWPKAFALEGVVVHVVNEDLVSTLTNDIILSFLRYNSSMLREMRAGVHDLVGRTSLQEVCSAQRVEIMARQQALDRAKDGMFELLGIQTPEERQDWELQSWLQISLNPASNCLSRMHQQQLCTWLKDARDKAHDNLDVKLELLYRASRDGWDALKFHSMCDNKGSTVTVIKSLKISLNVTEEEDKKEEMDEKEDDEEEDEEEEEIIQAPDTLECYIFGGYADASWKSTDLNSPSPNAFLFSLHNPSGLGPVKMPLLNRGDASALRFHPALGPSFGRDLRVSDGANTNYKSYSNVQKFRLPTGQSGHEFFTGSQLFKAEEVEVFRVL